MGKCNCGSKGIESKKMPEDKKQEETFKLDNTHYILIAGIIIILLLIKTKC